MKKLISAQLILKTGESFVGYMPVSQTTEVSGEVIFNTGMVGYVESLTDPSYAGQILCFTYQNLRVVNKFHQLNLHPFVW